MNKAYCAILVLLAIMPISISLLRTQFVELRVVRHVTVDGCDYLVWSDGQITVDAADQQRKLIRTLAAQALLEQRAAVKP